MTKLCITAHPSVNSFTNQAGKKLQDIGIEVIDLYNAEYKQEFLSFEHVLEQPYDDLIEWYQNKILQADEIILIFPIWWGGFPAIMKNFFDINFSYDFAFRYNNEGNSVPLLEGKTISIYCTCNSPKDRYEVPLRAFLGMHFKECCGIDVRNLCIFDNMRSINQKQKNEAIQLILKTYE